MKLVRLPIDNKDGLVKLGPFLAGRIYEVPDDVAPLLDPRLAPTSIALKNGEPIESITPTAAEHQEVFEHLRNLPKPKAEDAPKAPGDSAKANTAAAKPVPNDSN